MFGKTPPYFTIRRAIRYQPLDYIASVEKV